MSLSKVYIQHSQQKYLQLHREVPVSSEAKIPATAVEKEKIEEPEAEEEDLRVVEEAGKEEQQSRGQEEKKDEEQERGEEEVVAQQWKR